ncbi:MAG: ribonuclease J [Candidatus Berkelbacteria bacterium]|nr:MAG: ribonuclease J [Candidatus Berkelbacteria bacterium]QQG51747.1 MAG: ribonuclease J [Candidatus Berkelbacteria bacterium]
MNQVNPGPEPTKEPAKQDGVVDISDAGSVLQPNFQARSKQRPGQHPPRQQKRRHRGHGSPAGAVANTQKPNRPERRDRRNYRHASPAKAKVQPLKGTIVSRGHGQKLRIIPLGGSGETGDKNMLVFEYDRDILVVDAGVKFPTPDMPGIDYVVCDTTYLEENRDRIRAFLITHGHEDHIGGMPYIWPKFPVPIYTAPLTAGFIKAKFEEHGITNAEFRIIKSGEKIQIGAFSIEPVQMTHSIPDILGLAITSPAGLVFHATDWKVDFTPAFGKPTDFDKLAELSRRGVLCMLTDSTGVLVPGHTLSEQVVSKSLEDIFVEAKGRLIVSSFSSRIDRLQHVASACAKVGRRLFLAGRSMERNANIAIDLGYLKVPQGVLGDIRTVNSLPDSKIVVMCTGSQGEEGSALTRMSTGEHRHIRIKQGDTVVLSSSTVPGNERAVEQSINNLYRCGAEVVTKSELDIHSSGHGSREEIKHILNIVKPKYLIPIHGDYRRFVEMRKLAVTLDIKEENVLIIENGQIAEFDLQGKGTISDEKVQVGSVLIDGLGVGDVGEIVLRDRQTMAADGVFLIILTVDGRKGTLLTSPDIISRGFVYMKESEDLISETRAAVKRSHAAHISRTKAQTNWELFKKELRDDIGQFLFDKTQRRPMVIPVVIQV